MKPFWYGAIAGLFVWAITLALIYSTTDQNPSPESVQIRYGDDLPRPAKSTPTTAEFESRMITDYHGEVWMEFTNKKTGERWGAKL